MLSRKDLYDGLLCRVHVDEVLLPNGHTSQREVVDHVDGVAVLPLDERNNVLTVTQYRYVFGKLLLEIPAGKLDEGEDPVTGALRELEEETGAVPDSLLPLGVILPAPGCYGEKAAPVPGPWPADEGPAPGSGRVSERGADPLLRDGPSRDGRRDRGRQDHRRRAENQDPSGSVKYLRIGRTMRLIQGASGEHPSFRKVDPLIWAAGSGRLGIVMNTQKTVLIVEDEKNIVDILRFNLQREGYRTCRRLTTEKTAWLRPSPKNRI